MPTPDKAFQKVLSVLHEQVENMGNEEYLEVLEHLNGHIKGLIESVEMEIEEADEEDA